MIEKVTKLDTTSALPILSELFDYSDSVFSLFEKNNMAKVELIKDVRSYTEYLNWYTSQLQNLGLNECTECALNRKITVNVITISNNKTQSVPCAELEVRKILPYRSISASRKFVSMPCPEAEQKFSIGPKYELIVTYKGKSYKHERSITAGSNEKDVQQISLPVNK